MIAVDTNLLLCVQHAISELWTANRDFSRFAGLSARNPLT